MRGTNATKAWANMDTAERQHLRDQVAGLKGTALKEGVEVHLVQKVVELHEEFGGKRGEFRPLVYYTEFLRYTDEMCKTIQANTMKQYDHQLGADTFALIVWEMGSSNKTITTNEVMWATLDNKKADTSNGKKDFYM